MHRSRLATTTATAVVVASALGLTACGSSSDDSTASTAATAPSTASTSAAAPATSGAKVVDAADGKVTIDASDFRFSATEIHATAGKLAITMPNMGMAPHEFVLLKTTKAPASLEVSNGRVSEADSVGEIEEVPGGKSGTHTFDLKKGRYVYVCNVPGHYQDGMRGELVVS